MHAMPVVLDTEWQWYQVSPSPPMPLPPSFFLFLCIVSEHWLVLPILSPMNHFHLSKNISALPPEHVLTPSSKRTRWGNLIPPYSMSSAALHKMSNVGKAQTLNVPASYSGKQTSHSITDWLSPYMPAPLWSLGIQKWKRSSCDRHAK